ncbi:MAG TPA: hypothetical protein VL098_01370 [Flavipsychrobacter sp.]|nr:hypothetical protein [Flavipsychrobacter sp.]
MSLTLANIANKFKGRFVVPPDILKEKFLKIKAFVFDWDGVFNNGQKNENATSYFSEVDAMGTNLLRFNYFQRTGKMPVTAIISGENNSAAFSLAKREHFQGIYYGIKYKALALQHLCMTHTIRPEEVAFVFDDVLDFSMAEKCGLRIMVSRDCNPLLLDFAMDRQMADYISAGDGNAHAVRETAELLMGISGVYQYTIEARMNFTDEYLLYLQTRNQASTVCYTSQASAIIEKQL